MINPADDDVEAWFQWERGSDVLFFTRPAANLEPHSELYRRVETAIEYFRLNCEVLLLKERSRAICAALEACRLSRKGDEPKAQEIRAMASRWQPHGASVRRLLTRLAPQLIPPPDEDLVRLILNLADELGLAERVLAAEHKKNNHVQRFRTEILWALAVLWKDPPAGSPDLVERCLRKVGRLDEVTTLISQI